jgi:hypothetical protein
VASKLRGVGKSSNDCCIPLTFTFFFFFLLNLGVNSSSVRLATPRLPPLQKPLGTKFTLDEQPTRKKKRKKKKLKVLQENIEENDINGDTFSILILFSFFFLLSFSFPKINKLYLLNT